MQPVASIWYGVDQLTENYPNMGAYVYCAGNPVKLIDTDGRNIVLVGSKKTVVLWTGKKLKRNCIIPMTII